MKLFNSLKSAVKNIDTDKLKANAMVVANATRDGIKAIPQTPDKVINTANTVKEWWKDEDKQANS